MAAPEWCVRGTKKGAWPLAVETRKQHTVTVLRNVSGDVAALCKSLQDSLGAGGSTHGPLIELQGEHVDRCVAFLVEHRARVRGVRSDLLPADAPAPAPAADDDDVGPAARRKPRWSALRKEAAKPPDPRPAGPAAPGWLQRARLEDKCPLAYEYCAFRDACDLWRHCSCDVSGAAYYLDDDDGDLPPFYEGHAAGPSGNLDDVCEAFVFSAVAGRAEQARGADAKARKATLLASRAEKRDEERRDRARRAPAAAAPAPAKPAAWRPPKKRAARGKAWDDDDVAWGLGYRDDDDDDYDFAAGAYADADGVDDIESWNAAVFAAREERAAAADLAARRGAASRAGLAARPPSRLERDRAREAALASAAGEDFEALSDGAVLARADANGWSETYVAVLVDSGRPLDELEAPVMRAMLTLVARGADVHDAFLEALDAALRPRAADDDAAFFFGAAPPPAPPWACGACTLDNAAAAAACAACGTPRPAFVVAAAPAGWSCGACTLDNVDAHLCCACCGMPRPPD